VVAANPLVTHSHRFTLCAAAAEDVQPEQAPRQRLPAHCPVLVLLTPCKPPHTSWRSLRISLLPRLQGSVLGDLAAGPWGHSEQSCS
jgi:hypothetical protein